MRGGRILLIVGVVLVVVALLVGAYMVFLRPSGEPGREGEGTPAPTPMPADQVRIAVAAQNIPRGMRIAEEGNAVVVQNWPRNAVPGGAIDDLEAVYGRVARIDIPLGMPVLESMISERPADLADLGSDAALQIPEGMVAYALPVGRYSSVAWALQPGDHVDVVLSLLMVDLDEEFQTILPDTAACVSPTEEEGCQGGVLGRLEALPNGWLINLTPSEAQRPRLVTQLTVQNLTVLQVGDWPAARGRGEAAEEEEPAAEEGQAAPARGDVESLTLVVTRQEAMVLDYAQAIGARINFVLRRAGDEGRIPATEAITLQYLMEQYNIELPPKLPYGVTPPISRLERVPRGTEAAQYGPTGAGGGE